MIPEQPGISEILGQIYLQVQIQKFSIRGGGGAYFNNFCRPPKGLLFHIKKKLYLANIRWAGAPTVPH